MMLCKAYEPDCFVLYIFVVFLYVSGGNRVAIGTWGCCFTKSRRACGL